jgi:hypothetical protein
MALTTDHKPNDEKEKKRIEEVGGLVIYSKMDGVPRYLRLSALAVLCMCASCSPQSWHDDRLNGTIAVSRSLGDLHDPNVDGYMSQEPDINVVDLAQVGKSVRAPTQS